MIPEIAGVIIAPVAGWLVTKQLEINRKAIETAKSVEALTANVEHTRNRVDDIFDHLLNRSGLDKGRGTPR